MQVADGFNSWIRFAAFRQRSTEMSLNEQDALLSFQLGRDWPHDPLLNAVNLPDHLDVLDIGAGEGRLLNFLGMRGHQGKRTGLDPHPGPRVQQGYAEELPFPDSSFDVVFMIRMLLHCLDPLQALAQAQRVLRPGGELIVGVQGHLHLHRLWRQVGHVTSKLGAEEPVQELLSAAGLSARRLEVTLPLPLNNLDAADLLSTYDLKADLKALSFPLADTLHLVIFLVQKKGA